MSVKERLIRFAKSKEKSVRGFEAKLGFTIGYINAIRVSIQPDKIQSIVSHYPDLNITWLMTGDGNMLLDEARAASNSGKSGMMASTPYFPDINASAGLDFLADNGHNHSIPISIPNVDAEAFINVFGDSMYPKFCSGEIIGIKQIQKDMVFFGHAYVVEMIDNEAYLKYIKAGSDKDHWILASENTMYQPQEFHLEKIRKIFIIKAVISKITLL